MGTPLRDRINQLPIGGRLPKAIPQDAARVDPIKKEDDTRSDFLKQLAAGVLDFIIPPEVRDFVAREVFGMSEFNISDPERLEQIRRQQIEETLPFTEEFPARTPERESEVDRLFDLRQSGTDIASPVEPDLLQRLGVPAGIRQEISAKSQEPLSRVLKGIGTLAGIGDDPLGMIEGPGGLAKFTPAFKKSLDSLLDDLVMQFKDDLDSPILKQELQSILDPNTNKPIFDSSNIQGLQHLYSGGISLEDLKEITGLPDWSISSAYGTFEINIPEGGKIYVIPKPSGQFFVSSSSTTGTYLDNVEGLNIYLKNNFGLDAKNKMKVLSAPGETIQNQIIKNDQFEILQESNGTFSIKFKEGGFVTGHNSISEALEHAIITVNQPGKLTTDEKVKVFSLITGSKWSSFNIKSAEVYEIYETTLPNGVKVSAMSTPDGLILGSDKLETPAVTVKSYTEMENVLNDWSDKVPSSISSVATPTKGKTVGELKEEQVISKLFDEKQTAFDIPTLQSKTGIEFEKAKYSNNAFISQDNNLVIGIEQNGKYSIAGFSDSDPTNLIQEEFNTLDEAIDFANTNFGKSTLEPDGNKSLLKGITNTEWEVVDDYEHTFYETTLPNGAKVKVMPSNLLDGSFSVQSINANNYVNDLNHVNSPKELSDLLDIISQGTIQKPSSINNIQQTVSSLIPSKSGSSSGLNLTWNDFLNNKVGGQEGSNMGAWYEVTEGPLAGTRIYGKYSHGGDTHVRMEHLANTIYNKFGMKRAPNTGVVSTPNGLMHVSESVGENWRTANTISDFTPQQAKQVLEDFYLDVILANWDVVSYNFDNILLHESGVGIVKIDQGGSLLQRAAQGRKPEEVLYDIDIDWDKFPTTTGYGQVMEKAGYKTFEDFLIDNPKVVDKIQHLPDNWTSYINNLYPDWKDLDKAKVVNMLNSRTRALKLKVSNIPTKEEIKMIDEIIDLKGESYIDKDWPLWHKLLKVKSDRLGLTNSIYRIMPLDPEFKKLRDALSAWTGSSQNLRGSMAKLLGIKAQKYSSDILASDKPARLLLQAIAEETPTAPPLFRGIRSGGMRKYGELKVGDEIDLIPGSFSDKFDTANSFTQNHGVIFELVGGSRSLRIKNLSTHPENEWISGGVMEVISVEDRTIGNSTKRIIRIRQKEPYNVK